MSSLQYRPTIAKTLCFWRVSTEEPLTCRRCGGATFIRMSYDSLVACDTCRELVGHRDLITPTERDRLVRFHDYLMGAKLD